MPRATEGTLIDTATLLAELARPDSLSGDPTHGNWRRCLISYNIARSRQYRWH
ncbi:hypothetical protein ACLK1T_07865 [Escherichia coli]